LSPDGRQQFGDVGLSRIELAGQLELRQSFVELAVR
jgi:hypothetical protein